MDSITTTSLDASVTKPKTNVAKQQIRGSSLLMMGRFLSKGINFVVYILTVRYLTKADYGAFAYALSLVQVVQSLTTFGLDRAITRFVPIYHEQQDYNKLFGTLIMVVSTITSLGLAAAVLVYSFQGMLAQSYIENQQAITLLLILIFLAPVQAFDDLLVSLFAVFAKPKAIFFRKHVVGPGLRLAVVLLLVVGQSNVFFLASGYLVATIVGVVILVVMLFRLFKELNLFQHFRLQSITMPWFDVFTFTIPLLTSDLVYIAMNSMDAVLVEHFRSVSEVAALRAVQPTAEMNQLVISSFTTLFTPLAARLFAKNDREGINNLYWQTAVWIAVCSFPIFVLTFSLAKPVTVLLIGERYEQSATILALLALGTYFNAALGFNGLTLKVYGKLRYIVILNVVTLFINLAFNLLLIPRYGALGAAIGTTITLIIHNILKQVGLRLGTGINIFEARYFRVYIIITMSALALLFIQWITSAPVYISLCLGACASFLVFMLNRDLLKVGETFPELKRLPFVRNFLV